MNIFEQITNDFIIEYFGSKYLTIFNIKELTKSAMPSFIKLIKKYNKSEYTINDIDNCYRNGTDDNQLLDYMFSYIENEYFIEHYPFFKKFFELIERMSKDTLPNGDCSGSSDLQEITYKYNMKLYKFSKELCWSPKNHKYYSKSKKCVILHLIWCWKRGYNICNLPREILYLIISKIF